MKPVIKAILSPDIPDLPSYSPAEQDNFGFLLQLLIGPENEEGMESFQVTVCTPKWLTTMHEKTDVVIGRHYLIAFEYDYHSLMNAINAYVVNCEGDNWKEIALKLARFGKWEFEDYAPYRWDSIMNDIQAYNQAHDRRQYRLMLDQISAYENNHLMDKDNLIDNFKKAILDQDWAKCMNISESLFAQMPLDVVANLALKVVEDYAPNFQTEYPTDVWVSDRLSEIKYKLNNQITDNEDPTFPNFNTHYDTPGDNNFVGSVVELSLMLKYWNKSERAKELARDSIASIIMANSLRNWGKANPELWNRLMNPNNDSDRLILSTHFKTDPVVLDNKFEAWLSLANDIENWIRQEQS